MKYKIEPPMVDALFYASKKIDNKYQYQAMRYATYEQARKFLAVNLELQKIY